MSSVTATPTRKTLASDGGKKPAFSPDATPKSLFFAAVFSMTWQLAIAVVVPIVCGYELDQHFHAGALWEIVGFIIAGIGFFAVLRRSLSDIAEASKRGGIK
ncbi:MAG TPA: AtpZ/AtpI family protein [Candidatus Saccharimonadales bacterium]|nr:AtpZ/AtpI family protein [Candidatus Saccharimonadales bacterium]